MATSGSTWGTPEPSTSHVALDLNDCAQDDKGLSEGKVERTGRVRLVGYGRAIDRRCID